MTSKAQTRREALLLLLENADEPLAGGNLAQQLDVSRQIIVQDIALLREKGASIVGTSQGYVLEKSSRGNLGLTEGKDDANSDPAECSDGSKPFERTFKVHHDAAQTRDELETIISAGGRVANVSISHRAYGFLSVPLAIETEDDISRFINDIESGKSAPLSTATSGYHYHLIAADDKETLETIGRALADKGYLAPLLPHEMPK